MGICCNKRNKLEGETMDDVKKLLEAEILVLKSNYEVLHKQDYADEVRLIYKLILLIQLLMNLKYQIEKNKSWLEKNPDIKNLIVRCVRKYELLRESNFEPEDSFKELENDFKSFEEIFPKVNPNNINN